MQDEPGGDNRHTGYCGNRTTVRPGVDHGVLSESDVKSATLPGVEAAQSGDAHGRGELKRYRRPSNGERAGDTEGSRAGLL